MAWIGVDLDGTLARYDKWKGHDHIGEPIPKMLARVQTWLAEGKNVKIFTARVACNEVEYPQVKLAIEMWCLEHIGQVLEITNIKDFGMIELWDDRAIQVVRNKGTRVDGIPDMFDSESTRYR